MTRDLEAVLREARVLLARFESHSPANDWQLSSFAQQARGLYPRVDAALSAASGGASGEEVDLIPIPKAEFFAAVPRPAPEQEDKEHWRKRYLERLAERDALRARLEAAKEALKPFADVAEKFPLSKENVRPLFAFNGVELTYGDFRRARAAIAGMEGK